MTTTNDAWAAAAAAVIADNTLSRGGFADALRTVLTVRFTDAEAKDWIDAIATEYNRLGILNNPTYPNLRSEIINEGQATAEALFEALAVSINALPETKPALEAARLIDLRDDRDSITGALDRCDALIAAEPPGTVGRLVKEVLREGKARLRDYKERVRTEIRGITGDPDT